MIARYKVGEISVEEFVRRHLEGNVPALLEAEWTAEWRCRREWLREDGALDHHKLERLFGDAKVPVLRDGACEPETWLLKDYLAYLRSPETSPELLYLKDWHFALEMAGGEDYYEVPSPLDWDWMNEYWLWKGDEGQADYRFLYLGPGGSSTPFHADVLRSHSWSANVAGRKLWRLLPPGAEKRLRPGLTDLSELAEAESEALGMLRVEQGPGQLLFVPSDWHHQVENLVETLSINHNWFNAANFGRVWAYAEERLRAVEAEILEAREAFGEEWREQCQRVLRADIGIDFPELLRLLRFIRQRRAEEKERPTKLSAQLRRRDLQATEDFEAKISQRCEELGLDMLH